MEVIRLAQASQGARRRGRPPGSKNKPRTVISQAQLKGLKDKLGPYLPVEDMSYLQGVLEGTDTPVLERDLDVFLALQLKALLPQLAGEIQSGSLTREATQRSSVVKELLALRFQMEKHGNTDDKPDRINFITNIFNARGIDGPRIAELLGTSGIPGLPVPAEPRPVPRNVHPDEGSTDPPGAISGELLGGPE